MDDLSDGSGGHRESGETRSFPAMNVYERVLIIGHRGMLAGAIARQLERRNIAFAGVDRDTFDVTDQKQVAAIFQQRQPTLVFNCAAATNVDGCETDSESAQRLNGDALAFLAEMSAQHHTRFVHYSTDFVFDGEKEGTYSETDQPNPLSAYGKTKLLGEDNLRTIDPPGYLLLRTAWLYGRPGKCFPRTMVELAGKGIDPLKVVADQYGCPTLTDDLAGATLDLIDKNASGLFHATNAGTANWCEFAQTIMQQWNLPNRVEPLSSIDWKKMKPQSAHRPRNSVLNLEKIQSTLSKPMRPWKEALADYHAQVTNAGF
jgi:dTDP-4-dehydrorhamnose reductase